MWEHMKYTNLNTQEQYCGIENGEGELGLSGGGDAGFSEADFWKWVTGRSHPLHHEWHGVVPSTLLAPAQLLN